MLHRESHPHDQCTAYCIAVAQLWWLGYSGPPGRGLNTELATLSCKTLSYNTIKKKLKTWINGCKFGH